MPYECPRPRGFLLWFGVIDSRFGNTLELGGSGFGRVHPEICLRNPKRSKITDKVLEGVQAGLLNNHLTPNLRIEDIDFLSEY